MYVITAGAIYLGTHSGLRLWLHIDSRPLQPDMHVNYQNAPAALEDKAQQHVCLLLVSLR